MNIYLIFYLILLGIVIAFQLALAAGKPWGEYAMGGKYPGVLPKKMRIAAVIQSLILIFIGIIILIRSEIIFEECFHFFNTAMWFIVGFNIIATILNFITPSKKERMVWGPISLIMLVLSILIIL